MTYNYDREQAEVYLRALKGLYSVTDVIVQPPLPLPNTPVDDIPVYVRVRFKDHSKRVWKGGNHTEALYTALKGAVAHTINNLGKGMLLDVQDLIDDARKLA